MERLGADEERFVLLAMHQTLVERALCLRQHTDQGAVLIFPSYYRRERPELVGNPSVLVSYRFNGFLDDIYATLVVRLHHTKPFQQDQLWRYAADFCREKNVSDHGIDMEIEFKDDHHEATGEMLFLQLKSGDSYLRERKSDGAEIFKIKDERHARYWMAQKFPVLLVMLSMLTPGVC